MSRKRKSTNKDIISDIGTEIIDDSLILDYTIKEDEDDIGQFIPYNQKIKEEICNIIWINNNSYAIDFNGFGISFHVKDGHILDIDKIQGNFIKVQYEGEIGSPSFKCFPIYD